MRIVKSHNNHTEEINTDKEFQYLLPKLKEDQYAVLENDIVKNGCRIPLVVWNDNGKKILLDGYHRFAICKQNRLSFKVIQAPEVATRLDAQIWIFRDQIGKRNLDPIVRIKLALQLKELYAEKAKLNKKLGGKLYGKKHPKEEVLQNSVKPLIPVNTQKKLAELAGVSHDTIAKAERIFKNATEEQEKRLEGGEASINQIYNELKHGKKPYDPIAEIESLLKRFKWATEKGTIPIGTKLADRYGLSEEQKEDIKSTLRELQAFLNKMSEKFTIEE